MLGEIHPSIVTTRYASWLAFHPDPAGLRAALRHDMGTRTVFLAETGEEGGVCARLSNVLTSPGDLRLVFAHDSCGYHPDDSLVVGECEVVDSPAGLRVRRRDGSLELGLLEVLGDLLTAVLAQSFHLVPPAAHGPRIQIDDLVVSRESWTLPAAEPAFADDRRRGRPLPAGPGLGRPARLPRHVFLRFTGERKPIYADLTSLASIDLIARGAAPQPPGGRRGEHRDRGRDVAEPGAGLAGRCRGPALHRRTAHGGGRSEAARVSVGVYEFPTSYRPAPDVAARPAGSGRADLQHRLGALAGRPARPAALEQAWTAALDRHEALRTTFATSPACRCR